MTSTLRTAFLLGGLTIIGLAVWFFLQPDHRNEHLLVGQAMAMPAGGGAIASLTIENRGKPDRLIAVESSAVEATLFSPGDEIGPPVPVGASALAPDGAHIRLEGPERTFTEGALLPLTLTFAEAGEVTTKAVVTDPEAQQMAHNMDGDAHQGHGAAKKPAHGVASEGCIVDDGELVPSIAISAEVEREGWRVLIETENFTFSEELADGDHVPGIGHGHLFVGGMKVGRVYDTEAHIGALPKGRHEVRVNLNSNDHCTYAVDGQPVTATAMIDVD